MGGSLIGIPFCERGFWTYADDFFKDSGQGKWVDR